MKASVRIRTRTESAGKRRRRKEAEGKKFIPRPCVAVSARPESLSGARWAVDAAN
jgi:hypothetical protein